MATTYTLISSVTVGSGGAANITFSSIPATYTDLVVKMSLRTLHTNGPDDWYVRVNNVSTGSVYSYKLLWGTGAAAGNQQGSSQNEIYAGFVDWNNSTASTFASAEMYFPNYANTSYAKSISIDGAYEQNGTTAYAYLNAALYNQTTAISSIQIVGYNANWAQYTTAYLYGISNA